MVYVRAWNVCNKTNMFIQRCEFMRITPLICKLQIFLGEDPQPPPSPIRHPSPNSFLQKQCKFITCITNEGFIWMDFPVINLKNLLTDYVRKQQ